jgi:uncharacterized protein (TIGR02594 family)
MTVPSWYVAALKEIGTREQPENKGPAIQRYIDLAHCGGQGDPWCAIFANAMLESVGILGTRSAMARSFEHNSNFIKLVGPSLGAITTFWRTSKTSGLGHVAFYAGEQSGLIDALGGNESDMVRAELLNPHGNTFGLSGYYWPKAVPLPTIGKLALQISPSSGLGKVV